MSVMSELTKRVYKLQQVKIEPEQVILRVTNDEWIELLEYLRSIQRCGAGSSETEIGFIPEIIWQNYSVRAI